MISGIIKKIKTALERGIIRFQERRRFVNKLRELSPEDRAKIALDIDVASMVTFCSAIPIDVCEPLWKHKYKQLYGEEKGKLYFDLSWEDNLLQMGVYGFGWNNFGELGSGHRGDIDTPQRIPDELFKLGGKSLKIIQVSTGDAHTICLDETGDVWTFGNNSKGQLGLGYTSNRVIIPQRVSGLPKITRVSAGGAHTVCLDENENVWGFGRNDKGQLGLGRVSESNPRPQRILLGLPKIIQISAGNGYTICLDRKRNVWGFGRNDDGQLGLGRVSESNPRPQQVSDLSGINQVSAGGAHTVCLDGNENVWGFGRNDKGQLGLGYTSNRVITPQQISGLFGINQVSTGLSHTVCVDGNGNVWGFGWNDDGQLGLGRVSEPKPRPQWISHLSGITQVSAGGAHTVCVDRNGNVWVFGHNRFGQLGLGYEGEGVSIPQLIPYRAVEVSAGDFYTMLIGI